jgi:hypothetical protein
LLKERKQVKIAPNYPKNEELIPFGKLTQPILKNKADPLLLVNMARLEVQDLRKVVEEREAEIEEN